MSFTLELLARPEDIDQLGHVSNVQYVRWIIAAAEAHSTARGYDEARYRALGQVFVVRRHEIDYVTPALVGDVISARTWVGDIRAASCIRHTVMTRPRDNAVVLQSQTTWAYVSLASGRPTRIPAELTAAFASELPPSLNPLMIQG